MCQTLSYMLSMYYKLYFKKKNFLNELRHHEYIKE